MSTGSTSFKTIVATAIATAFAGALVTWIGGWLPALWESIKGATAWAWEMLTYPIVVPAVILVVLALPWLVLGAAWIKSLVAKKSSRPATVAPAEPPLGEIELQLLRFLARADGRYVGFEDAADHLHSSRLLLERACNVLYGRDLIETHRDVLHGPQIGLSREGRELVIKEGFLLGRDSRN